MVGRARGQAKSGEHGASEPVDRHTGVAPRKGVKVNAAPKTALHKLGTPFATTHDSLHEREKAISVLIRWNRADFMLMKYEIYQ